MTRKSKLNAVDLFAGSGGLSLGLARAGFRVRVAVEIDGDSVRTYRANHRGTRVIEKDIRKITGGQILKRARAKNVDLLAGCAPCQGFCSLTRKNRRRDPRNDLLLEMGRLAASLRPKAILMENVPGLANVGKRVFNRFLSKLGRLGYECDWRVVQMADHGVPQSRRRLVLLAGKGFKIPFPPPTHHKHAKQGEKARGWVTVREAIGGREAPPTLGEALAAGGPGEFDWHVVRRLRPATTARLKASLPGASRTSIDEELLPRCHRKGYDGFRNVYGRMSWDAPSPTITGGCTTPAKGRFGHPSRRRTTISVREAALLQSFPAGYKFETDSIDSACAMIGNAVPPRFAEALGVRLRRAIVSANSR